MITAAIHDARAFKIPNWIWISLMALFPLYALSAPREIDWLHHAGVFALVLAVGFALFAGNFAGAGDVKLLAVASLWAGPNYIGVLLVVTGMTGGILACFYAWSALACARAEAGAGTESIMQSLTKIAIPYGIAIAAGSIAVFGVMVAPIMF